MTKHPDGDTRALSIFEKVIGLPKDQRDQEVERLCAGDERLLESVCGLLDNHDDPASIVEGLKLVLPKEQPESIGAYRIIDQLGRGGMGVVYLAEQQEPVKRQVALKLIKLGMDSEAIVARFEHERQSLAVMQHDGIAKVYDCGKSERGQPYFVMELVDGVPLDTFCSTHDLGLTARLELMRQVCAAVAHAHQKGVIHRDLKPGNILVTGTPNDAQVKVIDFGLAKALDDRDGERTMFTEAGMVLGTPEYMAPEQADPDNHDIDTRADIYSLGVILYALLVDELPFEAKDLRAGGIAGLLRMLRDEPPPRPSSKLSTVKSGSKASTRSTKMASASLRRVLRADLDWVVLKALEKDRNRRYESADALSLDLQRFLRHEPLLAGPPSARYRVGKFLRRYRGQVVAAALVLLTGIIGLVTSIGYAFTAEANARAEAGARKDLAAKVLEYDQLSGVKLHQQAVERERGLIPSWPHKLEQMRSWLRDDAGRLLEMRDEIRRTIRELEERTPAASAEQLKNDEQTHPRYQELQMLRRRVAHREYMHAVHSGKRELVVPELTEEQLAYDRTTLRGMASDRIKLTVEKRVVQADEARGLAFARAALAASTTERDRGIAHEVLAWALLSNGCFDEAKQNIDEAVRLVPDADRERYQRYRENVYKAIQEADDNRERCRQKLRELEAIVTQQRTFAFEKPAERFLHDALVQLLVDIEALEREQRERVVARMKWAEQVEAASLSHPHARHSWDEVRAALAKADDVVASKLYANDDLPLPDEQVMGLVPIGMNPVTRLWEFYHLRSAWNGEEDPNEIPIPEHGADGSIEIGRLVGIVFVLVPGGTFHMGAQRRAPDQPNFDRLARPNESPIVEIDIEPFFLARHEMTQEQWKVLHGGTTEQMLPSFYKAGKVYFVKRVSAWNPVEQIDRYQAGSLLEEYGLKLPTEAQWEYACRAGSSGGWHCSLADLQRYANIADQSAKKAGAPWDCESWDDGYCAHAPVGSFLPNAFGFYDMHGNVAEWCHDQLGAYRYPVRDGDGAREFPDRPGNYPTRGGAFGYARHGVRSGQRMSNAATIASQDTGFRPARALNPLR